MPDGSTISHQLLQRAALRRTPVRLGVLDLLASSRTPLDVPGILAALPSRTDAVTVYRTLNTFFRKKLIHRIRGEDRGWRYAIGTRGEQIEHQHPHFVCNTCGKVECLTDADIPATLVKMLGVGPKYRVSYSEVVLHGLCPRCS